MRQLDKHAPMKEKYIRANNTPFMNKKLNKEIMNRSRLRNKLLKTPNATNKYNYKRQRHYVVNLLRREKRLDPHKISDSKKFWKAIKPLFSDKNKRIEKITDKAKTAEIVNTFFTNVVENLSI